MFRVESRRRHHAFFSANRERYMRMTPSHVEEKPSPPSLSPFLPLLLRSIAPGDIGSAEANGAASGGPFVLPIRRKLASHLSFLSVGRAVAPQILQFSFGDDPLNSGEMLSVSCTIVKGDFPVNLTWTFDDIPVDSSRQDVNIITNKRVSFLSIDSVAARHAGRYKCTASNAAGSDSHTAVLSVNGIISLSPLSLSTCIISNIVDKSCQLCTNVAVKERADPFEGRIDLPPLPPLLFIPVNFSNLIGLNRSARFSIAFVLALSFSFSLVTCCV